MVRAGLCVVNLDFLCSKLHGWMVIKILIYQASGLITSPSRFLVICFKNTTSLRRVNKKRVEFKMRTDVKMAIVNNENSV